MYMYKIEIKMTFFILLSIIMVFKIMFSFLDNDFFAPLLQRALSLPLIVVVKTAYNTIMRDTAGFVVFS